MTTNELAGVLLDLETGTFEIVDLNDLGHDLSDAPGGTDMSTSCSEGCSTSSTSCSWSCGSSF